MMNLLGHKHILWIDGFRYNRTRRSEGTFRAFFGIFYLPKVPMELSKTNKTFATLSLRTNYLIQKKYL